MELSIILQLNDASVGGMQENIIPGLLHSPGTAPVATSGSIRKNHLLSSDDCKPPPTGYQMCIRGGRAY